MGKPRFCHNDVVSKQCGSIIHHECIDINNQADEVFKEWMNTFINWNDYLLVNAPRNTKIKTFMDCYHFADPLRWYREVGQAKFPSVALFARLQLHRTDSASLQETVFSAAGTIMNSKQSRMDPDRFEQRALLYFNRLYISKNVHGFQKVEQY